jgi:hypothetical protein
MDLTTYTSDSASGDKGIHVLLESESWRFVSEKAHFGVYNIDP